ncbi:MAG: caspase family protein, partial [Cyanobacteria bacterium P01_H01_bin.121]
MTLRRRDFLKQVGLVLAGVGMSEGSLAIAADRYSAALATPSGRKLACLIGINSYPNGGDCKALRGCVNDVELQKQLLVHRFGFKATDVVTLTDQQATRTAIETTFLDHLVEQAGPDDTVVFHFSGYGATLRSPTVLANKVDLANSAEPTVTEPILFVADSPCGSSEQDAFNGLSWTTLQLLGQLLKTTKVIFVLDTAYRLAAPTNLESTRLQTRVHSTPVLGTLAADALEFQAICRQRAKRSPKRRADRTSTRNWPGVLLQAAALNQPAIELQWSDLSAGVFTYSLTQQLWQAPTTTPVKRLVGSTAAQVATVVGNLQIPQLTAPQAGSGSLAQLGLSAVQGRAVGAITNVDAEASEISVWLGGLTPAQLSAYGTDAVLRTLPAPPQADAAVGSPTLLQVQTRDRLTAKVKPLQPDSETTRFPKLSSGQPIQEWIRVIPAQVELTIALGNTLERIERVDATSAFSNLRGINAITVSEQAADYILARVSSEAPPLVANLPAAATEGVTDAAPKTEFALPRNRYALLDHGQTVLPETLGDAAEAIKTTIQRLEPRLQALRSLKRLHQLENPYNSSLPVTVSINQPEQKQPLARYNLATATDSSPL